MWRSCSLSSKRISLVTLLSFLVFSASLPAQVNFREGSWEEIKRIAQQEHKPIFVEATTSWCGVCKLMERNIFTDSAVAGFYNEKFVCWKADLTGTNNAEFGADNEIHSYPTLLFFEADGQRIFSSVGYRDETKILNDAGVALTNRGFEAETADLRKAFEYNTATKSQLYLYYSLLTANSRDGEAVGMAAINLMNPEDLQNDTAFLIWFNHDQRLCSPLLDYFLANRDYFDQKDPRMSYQKPHFIISYHIELARKYEDEYILAGTFSFIERVYSGEERVKQMESAEKKYRHC